MFTKTGEVPRGSIRRSSIHARRSATVLGQSGTIRSLRPLPQMRTCGIGCYRRLPPKFQRRLREQAAEFETLSRAASRKGKRG